MCKCKFQNFYTESSAIINPISVFCKRNKEKNNASDILLYTAFFTNKNIPNEETLQAMKDSRSGENLIECENLEQLFNECYENGKGNLIKIEDKLKIKIPKKEQWLWKNEKSLKELLQGLKESSEGKIIRTNGNLDKFLQDL